MQVAAPVERALGASPRADGAPSARMAGAVMAGVVLLWGIGPPVTKLVSAPALVAVSVRFWISAPLIWALAYASGRRISVEVLKRTALPGVFFAVNLLCVFISLQHASVAVLMVISSLQPGIVLLVAGPWLGERATRWHLVWTAVGVLGVIVVVLGGDPEVRGDALGVLFAAGATVTFTTYYLMNRRVRFTHDIHPLEWMAGMMLFAGLAITPVALATSSMDDYRQLGGADWLYLAIVGGAVGIVGHTMMSWAHRFIPASRSSLYMLGTNVVAVSVAWPLHDEPITLVEVVGGLIVFGAVAAVISRPASVRVSRTPQAEPRVRDFDVGPPTTG